MALDGKRGECRDKLDEAAGLLAESARSGRADEPSWISYFVEEQLAVHRGICLTDLGEPARRSRSSATRLPRCRPVGSGTAPDYLACSAQAQASNDDPEQAAAVA